MRLKMPSFWLKSPRVERNSGLFKGLRRALCAVLLGANRIDFKCI